MAEALYVQDGDQVDIGTAAAAYTGGEVIQLNDGRAAVVPVDVASGAIGAAQVEGIYDLAKTASIVILPGQEVFWDHSANKAHYKPVNDRDFPVGICVADSTSSMTTVRVSLNERTRPTVDLLRGAVLSVPTGTAAAGGFGYPVRLGGSEQLELTSTSEAQCIDMLSVDKFAVAAKGIAEFVIRPASGGSTSAVDINIGLANGTNTTDFDSVTEYCAFHIDGGSANINAQSTDGTTTVASTDTTADISAGSAVANRSYLVIDFRDNTNIKLYVDGARVLSGSTFKLNAATGPIGLIVHMEKSTGTATGKIIVDAARAWLCQQATV